MIDPDALMAREFPVIDHSYNSKDCILYALGLGLGTDPLNRSHLRATYERAEGFGALPAMVNVIGYPGFWAMEPDTGLTWQQILHGEQSLTLHAPLPAQGTLSGKLKITGIIDKGADKGALIYSERDLTDKATGVHVATVASTTFARADGGFGGASGPVKPVHTLPDTTPQTVFDFQTPENAALIYRLSGDFNPLHADPDVAAQVGPLPSRAALPARSCMVCARWAWRRGQSPRRWRRVISRPFATCNCVFPRLSIPARRSAPRCGARGTRSVSARASWSVILSC